MTSDAPMTGPADRDELRNRLAATLTAQWQFDSDNRAEDVIDALLPLIDEHTADAVMAERERIAQAIEAVRQQDSELGGPAAASAAFREAARIAREEHADE